MTKTKSLFNKFFKIQTDFKLFTEENFKYYCNNCNDH